LKHSNIKLTQYSKASGCGCKIDNSILNEIIKNTTSQNSVFPNLIVGNSTNDDAAVIALDEQNFLISTTDFFTPIVDNPYDFGRIAAANSISDVYAMGGNPLLAIGILGWPVSKIEPSIASEILSGAMDVCKIAGIPLAGGHTIENPDPFFGLAVNGLVSKKNLKTNAGAKPGNVLLLTKPLGLGVLSAAIKRELISEIEYAEFIHYSTQLNSIGAELAKIEGVTAMTDVTGFGFVGHLLEMTKASDLSVTVQKSKIPILQSSKKYANQFVYPDITTKNYNNYKENSSGLEGLDFIPLCDPQTNGGLLVAIDLNSLEEVFAILKKNGIDENCVQTIGTFQQKNEFSQIHFI
jgi:selenide, water dikinase